MKTDITSIKEFPKSDQGKAQRWATELHASHKAFKKFLKQGDDTVKRYRNQQKQAQYESFKLNLFNSNITTIKSMMFGKLPEIEFSRKHDDANDDTARVASQILQRMLNADIGRPNDLYSTALRNNLEDRLLPGLGVSRVRYEFDQGTKTTAPVIDPITKQVIQKPTQVRAITGERAPIDYVYWKDFRWSPAKTWEEVRWIAFGTYLTKDQATKRFGEEKANRLAYTNSTIDKDDKSMADDDPTQDDAFKRARVWEIWDKDARKVCWYSEGTDFILDSKDDPLKLTGFFPCPKPMTSNITTTSFMPIADFVLAQDSYNEIDNLETRITTLTEAVKAVGLYDASEGGIKRMLSEGVENELIPVESWAAFAEKGGIQGSIDWLPIGEVADVLSKLIDRRNDVKAMLYEVTGISDIMRGAASAKGAVSATERALEARFASVRIQALQDEFAQYATALIRLRAEVVSKHFQPESILKQSNITFQMGDQEYIQPAIEMIKNSADMIWRIQVKPESVAMVDYAQLKQERTDYITALATFMQSAAPLIEKEPAAAPVLMELLKWGMAGFKGSNEVEGVLDQAIQQMNEAAKKPQGGQSPSPEQIKAQMEQQKQQFEQQKIQMQQQFEQMKQQFDLQLEQIRARNKMLEIKADAQADINKEEAQAVLNMQEKEKETEEYAKRKAIDEAADTRILTHEANLETQHARDTPE